MQWLLHLVPSVRNFLAVDSVIYVLNDPNADLISFWQHRRRAGMHRVQTSFEDTQDIDWMVELLRVMDAV